MTLSSTITVMESDFQKLSSIIESLDSSAADDLDAELSRADIVPDHQLPANTVTMGSLVTFRDRDSDAETTLTLVFPGDADVSQMRISVLSPVGSALIGLGIGGTIDWPLPGGKQRRLEVTAVRQPREEASHG